MTAPELVPAVIVGGPLDGRKLRVDKRILTAGALELPEVTSGATPENATATRVRYVWDGAIHDDGAYRFRREAKS